MKRKRKIDAYVEIDGEIRLITLYYHPEQEDVTVYLATDNDLDDMVTDWAEFTNIYGDTYYKSLAGYTKKKKFKFSDLRKL